MVARGNHDSAATRRARRVNGRLPLRRLQPAAGGFRRDGFQRHDGGNGRAD